MHPLPSFNAALLPCPMRPADFSAHPAGYFCGNCQRVVQDFSQSAQPIADLAAARAASPDGRVCGRFRAGQLGKQPALTQRLKWFLVALVLVVGQGLTAREALAQVRKASPAPRPAQARPRPAPLNKTTVTVVSDDFIDGIVMEAPDVIADKVYTYVEQMPTFQGRDMDALYAYIRQHQIWPPGMSKLDAEGRVFVSFIVDKAGQVQDSRVVKGAHPLLDAEALRIVRALPDFEPGRQHGQPVAVSLTVPITFKRE